MQIEGLAYESSIRGEAMAMGWEQRAAPVQGGDAQPLDGSLKPACPGASNLRQVVLTALIQGGVVSPWGGASLDPPTSASSSASASMSMPTRAAPALLEMLRASSSLAIAGSSAGA